MDIEPRVPMIQGQDAGQAMNTVMARMIRLAADAMAAEGLERIGHIIVNRMHTLIKLDRAVLACLAGRKRIISISGDLEPSQDNSFSQAVHEARQAFKGDITPRTLAKDNLPEVLDTPNMKKILEAMGGTQVLWLPLVTETYRSDGYALWLERWNNKPWTPEEIKLISYVVIFLERALQGKKKKAQPGSKKRTLVFALIAFLALMWLPVYSTVNAPAQVTPDRPYHIFAPFDGILEQLLVRPGQQVKKGEAIFKYDTRVLEKQLDEAKRGVASALAELARIEGAGYDDADARARIPVQKLEIERKQAELAFIEKQLELSEVRTEAEGMVLLDEPDELIGSALRTGQLILRIADPQRTKVRIFVPVADVGLVLKDAQANVRLDSDPMNTRKVQVERIGFDVKVSEDRIPSVIVEGVWREDNPDVTPGQRGMAKIKGPKVLLGIQMFRKQLMSIRTSLGI